MINTVLLLIVAISHNLFYLVPNYHIRGAFRLTDIGLLLSGLLLMGLLMRGTRVRVMNGASLLIIGYFLMLMLQVVLATVNYDQSIMSGLVAARHQFYYMLYFVFLLALDDDEKVEKFMKVLGLVTIGVVVASVLNYAGFRIFYHEQWGEGQGERSGIARAYIPAMNLIVLMFVWYLTRYVFSNQAWNRYGAGALLMFLALLFRQTRGRIIAASLAALWVLFREGRLKAMAAVGSAAVILVVAVGLFLQQNVLVESYVTAYTDLAQGEGTWRGRSVTMQNAFEAFKEHPWVGSGLLVLRGSDFDAQAATYAYQGDLGYAHWLKNYGIVGVVWLLALYYIVWRRVLEARRLYPQDYVARFTEYAAVQVAISLLTINYLVKIEGIFVICLLLALATRHREAAAVAPPEVNEAARNGGDASRRILARRKNGDKTSVAQERQQG